MEPEQKERAVRWDDRKCSPNDHNPGIKRVYNHKDDHVCDDASVHRWVITMRFHCNCPEQELGDRRGYEVLRTHLETLVLCRRT